MKWITAILSTIAAVLLILPALFLGSYWYALAVAVVSSAGILLLREMPQSKFSDMLLIATSAMTAFALLLGIHAVFAVMALTLYICIWNAGHRFGHLDRVPVEDSAKRRFNIEILIRSLMSTVGIGLLLSGFLYVRVPMTFGLGLGLSSAVLITIALLVALARAARKREE